MIDGWFYINFIINKFRKIPLFMKLISAYFTVFLKTFKVSAFLMILFVYVSLARTLDSQNPNLTGQIRVFTGLSSWNITTQEYKNKRIFKPCLYFMYTT